MVPGLIDTHAHVYEHVTGKFGLAPDLVGVGSGVTTLVDQGGPSCMTIPGFRRYVAERAASRVLCFISTCLVGGLEGHRYPELYGPDGVNVEHTVRAIEENRDLVKGIKSHAEIGGASRWGAEVIKLGKEISRRTGLPLYVHLGQLWPLRDGVAIDADAYVREVVPLLGPGDVLAHPFTRHPGGFVSGETGRVHPIMEEALARGVKVDVGHGSHFSFDMARHALDAGIRPWTLGADLHGYNVRAPGARMSERERSGNPFFGVAPCEDARHGGRDRDPPAGARGRRERPRGADRALPALRQQRRRSGRGAAGRPGVVHEGGAGVPRGFAPRAGAGRGRSLMSPDAAGRPRLRPGWGEAAAHGSRLAAPRAEGYGRRPIRSARRGRRGAPAGHADGSAA